jgi:hypothetical protein
MRMSWPDGYFVTYDYDNTGNMTAIRENGGASNAARLALYSYGSLGQLGAVDRANGATTLLGYDPVLRMTGLTQRRGNGATELALGFAYNPAGQIISSTRWNDAYSYTGFANTDRTSSLNGQNQLTQNADTAGGGNVQALGYSSRANVANIGAVTYGYSSENLLTSGNGATLTYDPLYRLYSVAGGAGTTKFLYDGADLGIPDSGDSALNYSSVGITVPVY